MTQLTTYCYLATLWLFFRLRNYHYNVPLELMINWCILSHLNKFLVIRKRTLRLKMVVELN